jgi:two-component system nitrate/nitrite response regulator NarL
MDRDSFATILVASSAIFREGLERILTAAGFHVAAAASSIADIPRSELSSRQHILLVIVAGKDRDAWRRDIELFRRQYPSEPIALLGSAEPVTDHGIADAFRAGANAYFFRPDPETFIKALELVMLGETILPAGFVSCMLQSAQPLASLPISLAEPPDHVEHNAIRRLSPREASILGCLVAGDSNKKIARNYSIAEATVSVHVKTILRKIRVRNRTQAAIWGLNNGIATGKLADDHFPEPVDDTSSPAISGPLGPIADTSLAQPRS